MKGFFGFKGLESLALVHIKDVEYEDCVQQYFSAENNKELTFPRVLLWPALFLLFTVLCRDVVCRMKRRRRLGRHLAAPLHIGNSYFLPLSP
jgi:hypothetical protein